MTKWGREMRPSHYGGSPSAEIGEYVPGAASFMIKVAVRAYFRALDRAGGPEQNLPRQRFRR